MAAIAIKEILVLRYRVWLHCIKIIIMLELHSIFRGKYSFYSTPVHYNVCLTTFAETIINNSLEGVE